MTNLICFTTPRKTAVNNRESLKLVFSQQCNTTGLSRQKPALHFATNLECVTCAPRTPYRRVQECRIGKLTNLQTYKSCLFNYLPFFSIFLQFSISRYRLVVSIAPFVAPRGRVGSPKSCVRSSRPPPIPMPCCSTWSIPAAIFPN